MWTKVAVLGALGAIAAACGKHDAPPADRAGSGGSTSRIASGSASLSGSASPSGSAVRSGSTTASASTSTPAAGSASLPLATPMPALTKQQQADYKRHMKAGWAAQKRSKWADAVTAFEAALVAVPFDQRAESELGLSAMQAGDLATAKRADDLAVSQAVDHIVEAMSRFNYGALLEKTGDTAGALKQYQASLALRPNKTVQAAADRLAQADDAPAEFCAAGRAPCDCVIADAYGEIGSDDVKPDCEQQPPPVPLAGWHVYHVKQDLEYDYLLDDKHRMIAVIGDDNFRGHHDEHTVLDKSEIKTFGSHRVLWLETTSEEMEQTVANDGSDDDMYNDHSESQTNAIICVLGDPTTCPLTVPIVHSVTDDTISAALLQAGSNASLEGATKRTASVATKASVKIAADGTATVAVTAGKPDDALRALVGPHKLW